MRGEHIQSRSHMQTITCMVDSAPTVCCSEESAPFRRVQEIRLQSMYPGHHRYGPVRLP
jgi:hypothetical protein